MSGPSRPGPMPLNMAGMRFGRLVAKRRDRRPDPKGRGYWLCRCDCGSLIVVRRDTLKKGTTKSCGCLQKETARYVQRVNHRAAVKHDMYHTGAYRSWCAMKKRCNNGNSYRYYQGKGITYDPRWENFEGFYADMGDRPEGKTLDRKDGNGNYCKDNCRWATAEEQSSNKSSNRYTLVGGDVLTYAQAARVLGLDRSTVRRRVIKGQMPRVENNVSST